MTSFSCLSATMITLSGYSVLKKTTTRALHIVYNKPNLNLDKLHKLDKSTTIHIKYIKLHERKIPFYELNVHANKQYYNLTITNVLNFPRKIIGTNTFGYCTVTLWNQVLDSTKNEPNAKCFKVKITRN